MVLETGKHPEELKDMVASPGGTTIEVVKVLEDQGFCSAIIQYYFFSTFILFTITCEKYDRLSEVKKELKEFADTLK